LQAGTRKNDQGELFELASLLIEIQEGNQGEL